MLKRLVTTLSIGEEAQSLRKASIPLMEAYAERCDAEFKVLTSKSTFLRSQVFYEKFQIRDLLEQYERVLYIDLDVLVSPLSPDLFEMVPLNAFGATSVEPVLNKVSQEKEGVKKCFGDIEWSIPYFNAGVMLLDQSAKPMLEFSMENQNKWIEFEEAQDKGYFEDQTLLNYALNLKGPYFFDLGKSFNFTRAWGSFENRFSMNFIHYAGLSGNRDWQMYRDYRILVSKSRFWLYRNSSFATWFSDRLTAMRKSA